MGESESKLQSEANVLNLYDVLGVTEGATTDDIKVNRSSYFWLNFSVLRID
jgi:hypothetical protein